MAGFMGGKQLGFGDYEQSTARKRTKRERFLAQMEAVVPWKALIDIHSVETTAANVHDLTPAAELLHGQETVVYADSGYQGIGKREEMKGKAIGFRVAMRPGKRRALPDTPEGRLDDLVETALAGTASACSRLTSVRKVSTHSA
jgi:IS5 family transposase